MRPAGLVLYHYPGCVFCGRVWSAAKDLGLDLEDRNIWVDAEAAAQLGAATLRQTVPVLRIEGGEGEADQWLPESADIVTYLYAKYGDGKRPSLLAAINPQLLLMTAVLGAIALDSVVQPSWPWVWLLPIAAFVVILRR